MTLLDRIRDLFEPALRELSPDPAKLPDYLAMVKPAKPDVADYQANFAMPLAKAAGKKPPELAKEIVAKLPANDLIESATVAGPGFINLKLSDKFLAAAVHTMAADDRLGIAPVAKPKTFVIDYSSPNVAKPLHVGHLRSTIIGDALTRLLRFLGHRVITDNHLGDWGTQFGMLIYGYKNLRDEKAYQSDPLRELTRLYLEVRRLGKVFNIIGVGCSHWENGDRKDQSLGKHLAKEFTFYTKKLAEWDEDEVDTNIPNPIAELYREETAKLHHGDPENVALWREFMPHCMAEIHAAYERLGILPFDHEHGESYYNPMLPGVVEDLLKSGVAEPGEGGAVIIRFSKDNVSLVRKRDGAFTYTTSDLATIRYRVTQWKPDAALYVVDFRQGQHFANLFAAAKRWGYADVSLTHVSFGSVLGKDGRPLKTREGTAVELGDLLDEAERLGLEKYRTSYADRKAHGHDVPELTDDVVHDIAIAVGIGAVKYADLSQNRTSDYKYDPEKMTATEGNTAAYMQYAYARCHAIFRQGDIDPATFRASPPSVVLTNPHERALALQLLRFGEALEAASTEYLPHLLTAYLWDLAKAYSGFYENSPVLKAETPELRDSRLLLVDLVARVIRQTLDLLGIRTVERM